ncbi:polyribonucleotide nucleotidyltransferase [candidate division KSB1 bacterium]
MEVKKSVVIGAHELTIETGKIAKQASGSVVIQYGETVILAACTASNEYKANAAFVPLTVDYREKAFAAGKIPGGFFKREGRPTDKETLSARLTDRPIRALFNKDFKYETMVMISVLSYDQENDSDVLGIIGASAALCISDIPFDTPISAVRVGKVNGSLVINPTAQQLTESTVNMVVAGTMDSLVMVEGESKEITNEELVEALEFAHENIKIVIPIIEELMAETGKKKREYPEPEINQELIDKVRVLATPLMKEALKNTEKVARHAEIKKVKNATIEEFGEEYPDDEHAMKETVTEIEGELLREGIIKEGKRVDHRGLKDVRPISCEVAVLPRTHGSALFTRGETQSLAVATLGTKIDEQKIEGLEGQHFKRFILHYNFPPYSVGEVKRIMGPGRREIGHGRLAEKALEYGVPTEDEFPYTIRVVSDILESNGSSSMASVCAGSLALMDAGIPVKNQTAGIAMGLIKDEDNYIILSDILGDEDHLGDMDFKVAGSSPGITAFQMDIKVKGIPFSLVSDVLRQAREGIDHILNEMNKVIDKPRDSLSPYAPTICIFKIDVNDIGTIIGPGGKMIREIQDKTDSTIYIDDDGTVILSSVDQVKGDEAKRMIEKLLEVPEVGKTYDGKVKKITPFGAFVEVLPGKEGLLHISEIAHRRINKVEDVLKLGQSVKVRVKKIDPLGKVDLTHKEFSSSK